MSSEFEKLDCSDDDVLTFGEALYKVSKFKNALNESFSERCLGVQVPRALYLNSFQVARDCKTWFGDGVDFKILSLGSTNWRKAKVRIKYSLEFYVEKEDVPKVELQIEDVRSVNQQETKLQIEDVRLVDEQENK